jgi:hypothetical protein
MLTMTEIDDIREAYAKGKELSSFLVYGVER